MYTCAICLTSGHQSHKLTKIDDVYTGKLNAFYRSEKMLSEYTSENEEIETQLDMTKSEELTNYNDIKKKILHKEDEIKEAARKKSVRLVRELDQIWIPSEKRLSEMKSEITRKVFKKEKISLIQYLCDLLMVFTKYNG